MDMAQQVPSGGPDADAAGQTRNLGENGGLMTPPALIKAQTKAL